MAWKLPSIKSIKAARDVLDRVKPALRWRQKSPAYASGPRRAAARERKGRARVRLLQQRHSRGDFGQRELARRITQTWQSI